MRANLYQRDHPQWTGNFFLSSTFLYWGNRWATFCIVFLHVKSSWYWLLVTQKRKLIATQMFCKFQIAPFDIEFSVTHKELDFSHLLVSISWNIMSLRLFHIMITNLFPEYSIHLDNLVIRNGPNPGSVCYF